MSSSPNWLTLTHTPASPSLPNIPEEPSSRRDSGHSTPVQKLKDEEHMLNEPESEKHFNEVVPALWLSTDSKSQSQSHQRNHHRASSPFREVANAFSHPSKPDPEHPEPETKYRRVESWNQTMKQAHQVRRGAW